MLAEGRIKTKRARRKGYWKCHTRSMGKIIANGRRLSKLYDTRQQKNLGHFYFEFILRLLLKCERNITVYSVVYYPKLQCTKYFCSEYVQFYTF